MNQIDNILNEVLKRIIPLNKEVEIIENVTQKLKKLLELKAKELNINYLKIEPQGSTGIKQTQLRNDFDIDLFIGLDFNLYKHKYEGLSRNKLKKESKQDFYNLCNNWIIPSIKIEGFHNPRLSYAEHPYVTVEYYLNGELIKIDIVLYFEIDLEYIKENGPITAVDRSPWHGRFIRGNLTEEQKNDVRLLKQFFKACHSYGDKSAIGKIGFIGYSSELLIYYLGNIKNTFKNFSKLPEMALDFYKRNEKELRKIAHFEKAYILLIDPIDKKRNVASAISKRAYVYCNQKVKEFLKNPSQEFFEITPIPEINITNMEDPVYSKIFIIEFESINREIHYTINRDKLYSLGYNIKNIGEKEISHAERFGKIIFEVYFEVNQNQFNLAFYCENPIISKTYFRKGPPLKEKKHISQFKKKNPNYFEKDAYLWVERTREFKNFLNFLKIYVKNNVPENLIIKNISKSFYTKSSSGKKTIHILKNIVLPLFI